MKTTSLKKVNTSRLLVVTLQVIFLALLAYQAYFIYGLYQSLQIQPSVADTTKTTRSNLTAYRQAMQRFQDSLTYELPTSDIKTPFKTPPKATN